VQVRRVVTGTDAQGKSVFASDELVDGITMALAPGLEFHRLWGSDAAAVLPDAGGPRPPLPYFPGPAGFRFDLFTVPPDHLEPPADLDVPAALAEMEAALPGMVGDARRDGDSELHATDTIDYEYVISGRVILELDDGATVELGPGDTVVQNGTRHVWRNPYDEPCRMVLVLVGATRA
jgi:mannose-6-phosphate isomerase-like protein (cupin superfamily)